MLKDVRIFHFHTFNLWIRVLYKASLRLGLRSELPIFALDVPFSTTRDDISLIAAENKFLPNHITMPQIRDSRFNLKHLNQIFMRGIFRHKKLLMTRTERVFKKKRFKAKHLPLRLLYLRLRRGNTHHLGNKYSSSLSIVTIVKHVTSPLWGAAAVCLLHGTEGKTDCSLYSYMIRRHSNQVICTFFYVETKRWRP